MLFYSKIFSLESVNTLDKNEFTFSRVHCISITYCCLTLKLVHDNWVTISISCQLLWVEILIQILQTHSRKLYQNLYLTFSTCIGAILHKNLHRSLNTVESKIYISYFSYHKPILKKISLLDVCTSLF